MKKIVLLILGIILVNSLLAQTPLQKADSFFIKKNYYNSIQLYNKALKKAKSEEMTHIYFQLGECYRFGNNYEQAMTWYQKAINAGCTLDIVNLYLGEMFLFTGDYSTAKTYIEKYLSAVPNDNLAKLRLESCNLGLKGQTEKPLYEIHVEKTLSSDASDYGISYFKNNKLIFASTRSSGGSKIDPVTLQGFSDIFESTFDPVKGLWSKPTKLKGDINTNYNEGTFSYGSATNTGYYMQCNGESGKKLNCNILCSNYNETTDMWEAPKIFDYNSPAFSVGHPTITADGKTMYFVSDMPGGYGGKDIYVIKKVVGTWGKPENLGPIINTIGDEMFPFVSGDTVLVFASDGHPGFGGLDLFTSSIKKGKFSKPVNMMPPFNSSADDFNLIFKDSRNSGLFCSNRVGGVGNDDIYTFSLIPVILTASGNIKDKATNKNLEDAVVLLVGNSGSIDSALTDSKGNYEFIKLKQNVKYNVKASKTGYLNDSKNLSVENEKYSKEYNKSTGYDLDFLLIKITKAEVKIDNIYYDYDSASLRPESKIELNKLINVLKETPDVKVQINAHTDERGAVNYNMDLSQRRAQSVVDYLIANGINHDRLFAKGYGFSMPLIKKAKTEEQHQMNRRTTFKILNSSEISTIRNIAYNEDTQPIQTNQGTTANNTNSAISTQTVVTSNPNNVNTDNTTTNQNTTANTNTNISNANTTGNTSTQITTVNKKVFIIAGSYPTEQQAKAAVDVLKSKGFPDAEVVGKNNAGSIRICYKGYVTREEAMKDLPEIKQKYPSAWLFEKK